MADHDHEHFREFDYERVTSPMQAYDTGDVTTGIVVAVVGILLAFGVPLALLGI
jgi:hypothetical protein